jgi:EamA domain-containing membrane protein RarD
VLKVPFRIPRRDWRELLWLTATNMFVWHVCIILAVRTLTSGRAAILGYTMPIFSAVLGALFFASPLSRRAWTGVSAAALGVVLLLWHEFTHLAGRPFGVLLALVAAAFWALGTQMLRRTRLQAPALAISFWMTVLTALLMAVLAIVFERPQWTLPDATASRRDPLQRGADLRLRACRLDLPGARPAAGGLHAERDADPGAGRLQRRAVAEGGGALAGLGRGAAHDGGDRVGPVARTTAEFMMRRRFVPWTTRCPLTSGCDSLRVPL